MHFCHWYWSESSRLLTFGGGKLPSLWPSPLNFFLPNTLKTLFIRKTKRVNLQWKGFSMKSSKQIWRQKRYRLWRPSFLRYWRWTTCKASIFDDGWAGLEPPWLADSSLPGFISIEVIPCHAAAFSAKPRQHTGSILNSAVELNLQWYKWIPSLEPWVHKGGFLAITHGSLKWQEQSETIKWSYGLSSPKAALIKIQSSFLVLPRSRGFIF